MKMFKYVAMLATVLMVTNAYAEEAAPAADKKPLVVRLANPEFMYDNFKISPTDFPDGVYVSTLRKPLFRDPVRFQKVEEILAEKLKKLGFKIADTEDSASAVFMFNTTNELDLAEINKGQTDNVSRGLSIADNVIGAVIGGKLMGTQYTMTNGVALNLDHKNIALEVTIKGAKNEALNKRSMLTMYAEYSENNYITSTKLLDMLFDEWAKVRVTIPETK